MSSTASISMPIVPDASRRSNQEIRKIDAVIELSLHEKVAPGKHDTPEPEPEPEHTTSPLKQIIAHQDSLYKHYLSWEDPVRTIGSFIGANTVLFGVHYLPLTQYGLKAVITALGLVSVTEFASRSLSTDSNSLSTRIRPKNYKKVPEPVLNGTLKDVHDFIQYAVVQTQEIIFAQDLAKTSTVFFALTAMYWLIKVISPFWLAVTGLALLYIIPLARSRVLSHANTSVHAQKQVTSATDSGNGLTPKPMVSPKPNKLRQSTYDTGGHLQDLAPTLSEAPVTDRYSSRAGDMADLHSLDARTGTIMKQPKSNTGTAGTVLEDAGVSLDNHEQNFSGSLQHEIDGISNGTGSIMHEGENKHPQVPSSASNPFRPLGSGGDLAKHHAGYQQKIAAAYLPGQVDPARADSVLDIIHNQSPNPTLPALGEAS